MIDEKGLNAHREQTVKDIIEKLKNNKRVACIRYPSYGKSYYIVRELVPKLTGNIIIIVPTDYLNVTYKNWFNGYPNVKILTYQILKNKTNVKQQKIFKGVKYFICDECHHLGDNQWRHNLDSILKQLDNQIKVIGLTATPLRSDGSNVVDEFFNGVQVKPLTMLEAIDFNFIPKVRYVVGMLDIDDSIDKKLNDIDRYKVKNLLNISKLLGKHIEQSRIKDNLKILVFTNNTKELDSVEYTVYGWFKNLFNDVAINMYQVSYRNTVKENRKAFETFEKKHLNTIDIMISIDKLGEGVHLPDVGVEIMLRKTSSPVVFTQQMGRVIGNKNPVVIDLVNNASGYIRIESGMNTRSVINSVINETIGQKIIYSDCVEIYDETRELREIVAKYTNLIYSSETQRVVIENEEYIRDNPDKLSIRQMAYKLGIPYRTFIEYVKKTNIMKYNPNKGSTQIVEQNREYIEKNPDNLTFKEIANRLGINEQYMRRVVKNKKIPTDWITKNGKQIAKARQIVEQNREYIEKNPEHLSIKKLSKKLGIGINTFLAAMNEKNITINGIKSNLDKGNKVSDIVNKNRDYIESNIDNLTLTQMAHKYNIKSIMSFKRAMILNNISFDNYSYFKSNGLFPNMDNLIANKTYIITNPKKLSISDLGKEFGVSEHQMRLIITYLEKYE